MIVEKQEDKRLVKKNGDRWRKWEQEQGDLNQVWPLIYRPGLHCFTLIKTSCDLS